MTLDKDVVHEQTGTILIPEGTSLTRPFINRLDSYGIDTVFIREEIIPDELYNKEFIAEYSLVENRLESIFEEVQTGKDIETCEIIDEIHGFVNQVALERDILTQMRLLRKKDDYTFNHSIGVSILAITLGKWLDYPEEKLRELAITGMFHDIGKLKIPDSIVKKPGRLTVEECREMKKHSYYSYEILAATNKFSPDILQGALQHHEKCNGSGYPHGLSGDKIHPYAKIISICDIYHALTSNRVYKDKDSPFKTADYLRKESFGALDPHITHVFLKNISKFYVGNKVLISDGSTGNIVYIHPQDETRPIVKIGDKFVDFMEKQDVEILDVII